MLFTIIRRNEKLAAKRSPMFDKNRFAKFLIYFMVAYWAALLLFMGVTLPSAFESAAPSMEPYHILNQGLIYVLITDFLVRFVIQTATSHEIKPYLLMPVKKKKTDRHPTASVGNKPLQPLLVFPFRTIRFSFHLPLLWNDRNNMLPDRYMVTHGIEQLLVSVMQDAAQRKDRVLIASVGCI